jgi:hypothetical protein
VSTTREIEVEGNEHFIVSSSTIARQIFRPGERVNLKGYVATVIRRGEGNKWWVMPITWLDWLGIKFHQTIEPRKEAPIPTDLMAAVRGKLVSPQDDLA